MTNYVIYILSQDPSRYWFQWSSKMHTEVCSALENGAAAFLVLSDISGMENGNFNGNKNEPFICGRILFEAVTTWAWEQNCCIRHLDLTRMYKDSCTL